MRSRVSLSRGAAPSSGRKSARTRNAGGTPTFSRTSDASLRTASVRISFSSIGAPSAGLLTQRWDPIESAPLRGGLGGLLHFCFGYLFAGPAADAEMGAQLPVDLRRHLRMIVQELLRVLATLPDALPAVGIPGPTLLNDSTFRAKV